MRAKWIGLPLLAILALASCERKGETNRNEPAARQVGREAYQAGQDIKRGAKKAANDIREAGRQFREGWSEAKHDQPSQQNQQPDH